MTINLNKMFSFLIMMMCTIDLPSALIVYGTQIIGLSMLTATILLITRKINLDALFICVVISFFIILISYVQSKNIEHVELIWNFTFRIIFWILLLALIYPFLKRLQLEDFFSALRLWILIFSSCLYLQFIAFYTYGSVIDYSVLLNGEPSRILNIVGLRASGLTAEPSIYSGMMISLMSLYYMLNRKNDLISYYAGISILLTFSTLGFFLFISYFFITSLRYINFKKVIFLCFVLFSSIIAALPLLLSRYERFTSGDDVSNNVKFMVIDNLLNNTSLFLFGYGLIGYSPGAPDFYQALYDLTLFGNFIVIFGIPLGTIFSILTLIVIISIKIPLTYRFLILLTLIKISIPNYLFFYLFVFILFAFKDRVISHEKNSIIHR